MLMKATEAADSDGTPAPQIQLVGQFHAASFAKAISVQVSGSKRRG